MAALFVGVKFFGPPAKDDVRGSAVARTVASYVAAGLCSVSIKKLRFYAPKHPGIYNEQE